MHTFASIPYYNICIWIHAHVWWYPNRCRKKRIAFGPEIYIIHWDYLTLEYDDVTIVNERLSDWALACSIQFTFSFSTAFSGIYLCYTQMPLTQTYVQNTEHTYYFVQYDLFSHRILWNIQLISACVTVISCAGFYLLYIGHARDKLFIYLFCKRTQYKCGTKVCYQTTTYRSTMMK